MQSPEPISRRETQLRLLNEVIADTFSRKGNVNNLLLFIKRTLRQFKLDAFYQEGDILIEVYIRARTKIESGESIDNLVPWLKGVSFNIIREKYKQYNKNKSLQNQLVCNGYGMGEFSENAESEYVDCRNIKFLIDSLQSLTSEDLEILTLRIIKGLPWDEICEILNKNIKHTESGNKEISQATLRKRGERALKRLRQNFLSVNLIN